MILISLGIKNKILNIHILPNFKYIKIHDLSRDNQKSQNFLRKLVCNVRRSQSNSRNSGKVALKEYHL